jgi:hypothetical protein
MRIRNLWFELLSFATALFMFGCAFVSMATPLPDGVDANLPSPAIAAGFFLILSLAFFRTSLQLGGLQRRRRDQRKEKRAQATRPA